jgi:outer membrane receptor for ferrienterochelin and colicins
MGYEFNQDEMNDKAPAYKRNINQNVISNGFFFQDDWFYNDNISLIWGLRLDKHNLIQKLILNPRASLLYKPIEDLSIRATYSTGYRAPQAFDEDLHITQVGGAGMVILLDKNLKPEYSHSISASADFSARFFDLPLAFSFEFFTTTLNDVFILEDNGTDDNGNRLMLRKNGESALVQGITFETFLITKNDLSFKLGLTYQKSTYSKPVEWSEGNVINQIEPQYSDKIFRTPDLYGYFLASINLFEDCNVDISGNYTGEMYVPHYSGFIENDILIKSKPFFDLNLKISYRFIKNPGIELSLGVLNILNSYQDDFDFGIDRDAGYIYGPFRPFTSLLSIKINS